MRSSKHSPLKRWALGGLALALLLVFSLRLVTRQRAWADPIGAPAGELGPQAAGPWDSLDACRAAMKDRKRSNRDSVRLATWNLHWFPDGRPGRRSPSDQVDPAWLACSLALLDAAVIAVQELKTTQYARLSIEQVIEQLNAYTAGDYALKVDPCPRPGGLHVGLLYDRRRVSAKSWATYAELNPHAGACEGRLRPGYGAYLRFSGALDLHLISVHLKSGVKARDYELRRESWRGLSAAYRQAQRSIKDTDLIVAGDLNTMGCRRCKPRIDANQELSQLSQLLGRAAPRFRLVSPDQPCTEYYKTRPGLLDHWIVSAGLSELPASQHSQVRGVCAALGCRALARGRKLPLALSELSDHCPLILELLNRDLD